MRILADISKAAWPLLFSRLSLALGSLLLAAFYCILYGDWENLPYYYIAIDMLMCLVTLPSALAGGIRVFLIYAALCICWFALVWNIVGLLSSCIKAMF